MTLKKGSTGFPCPRCGQTTRTLDSRNHGGKVRRRRECPSGHRLSTVEEPAELHQGELLSKAEIRARTLTLQLLKIKDTLGMLKNL